MPRVLQITDKPFPGGGIRRVVEQQRDLLEPRGWDCTLLRLVHRGALAGTDTQVAPVQVARLLPDDAASIAAVRCAASRADVVNLHLGFTAISPDFVTAAAASAPLVVSLHDVSPFEGMRLPEMGIDARDGNLPLRIRLTQFRLRQIRREVWCRICSDARVFVAPSHFLARLAQAAGAPVARIRVVPHVSEDTGTAAPTPSTCPPVIAYAGLISDEKGTPLLIDTFARLKTTDARLVILGEGPALERLKRQTAAKGLGDRIEFRGQVDAAEVARILAGARVLAHPSLVPEGFGLVGIEAMQTGRPVAGFGLGGCGDWLIHDVTGLVAERQNSSSLATCLDRLLGDGVLADRLGAAAQRHVKREFSALRVADALVAALNSARSIWRGSS